MAKQRLPDKLVPLVYAGLPPRNAHVIAAGSNGHLAPFRMRIARDGCRTHRGLSYLLRLASGAVPCGIAVSAHVCRGKLGSAVR